MPHCDGIRGTEPDSDTTRGQWPARFGHEAPLLFPVQPHDRVLVPAPQSLHSEPVGVPEVEVVARLERIEVGA